MGGANRQRIVVIVIDEPKGLKPSGSDEEVVYGVGLIGECGNDVDDGGREDGWGWLVRIIADVAEEGDVVVVEAWPEDLIVHVNGRRSDVGSDEGDERFVANREMLCEMVEGRGAGITAPACRIHLKQEHK